MGGWVREGCVCVLVSCVAVVSHPYNVGKEHVGFLLTRETGGGWVEFGGHMLLS